MIIAIISEIIIGLFILNFACNILKDLLEEFCDNLPTILLGLLLIGGVVFLSGGQNPKQATENLREIMRLNHGQFHLSFSFGRALADPALVAWKCDDKNIQTAKAVLDSRLQETCEVME